MTMQALNEDTVASFLKQNNDFFNRNVELLKELEISHQTDGAVSLIERQVSVLRENNRQLKIQLKELVDIAKDNERLNNSMHQLALEVLKTQSAEEIITTTCHHLKHQFDSEIIAMQLISELFPNISSDETSNVISKESDAFSVLTNILNRGKPVCGKLTSEQLQVCFREHAENAASAAIIPLVKPHNGDILGFIGIGSSNAKRFHISMGTVFLERLGQIIGHALARYI